MPPSTAAPAPIQQDQGMPDRQPPDPEAGLCGSADPCAAAQAETLGDLGEWELIRRLGAFAPAGQFADDAALVPLAGVDPRRARTTADRRGDAAAALVINTDVLVEGIHFSEATTGPLDVGWRAAAANLSDLAAMGCTAGLGITVGLVAPASTPWPWVEGVYQGLSEALRCHGGVLLGGDCSGGSQRLLAVTALGRLPAQGGPIRRGDGRPGDRLVCTGPHGLSRLGLALLQNGQTGDGPADDAAGDTAAADGGLTALEPALVQRAIRAHRRPVPRFDAVRALIDCHPDGLPWRVGGCDSSDGLIAGVTAIAAASGCAVRLERGSLPLDPAMATLPQAEAWCLNGGEDFELLLALPTAWADALLAALPGVTSIGQLTEGTPGALSWTDSGGGVDATAAAVGFQHFS